MHTERSLRDNDFIRTRLNPPRTPSSNPSRNSQRSSTPQQSARGKSGTKVQWYGRSGGGALETLDAAQAAMAGRNASAMWRLLQQPHHPCLLGQEGVVSVVAGHLAIVGLGAGQTNFFSKAAHGIGREEPVRADADE